ncbi:MAG: hypothetical protein PHO37_18710, partial [Kiritimatiellae bacterium]|nr:hypothetical protein [Kiritimatiellia bacterium]
VRFWSVANLCQAGLVTRWMSTFSFIVFTILQIPRNWAYPVATQSGYYTDRYGLQAGLHFKVQRMCSSRSTSDTEQQTLRGNRLLFTLQRALCCQAA